MPYLCHCFERQEGDILRMATHLSFRIHEKSSKNPQKAISTKIHQMNIY